MAIGKFRKGARPRTRWWQPAWWELVVGGGYYYPVTHSHCVHDIRVCVCVYNLSERDWHAIEINRCGCVMATISNIRGGGYCEIDCTCFFSPLPFFLFFLLSYDYNERYRGNARRKFEWKERSRCSIPLRKVKRPLSQTMKPSSTCALYVRSRCALWIISSGIRGVHSFPRNLLDSYEWWVLSLSLVEVEMVLKGWLLMVDAEHYFRRMYDLYVRPFGMLYSMYLFSYW